MLIFELFPLFMLIVAGLLAVLLFVQHRSADGSSDGEDNRRPDV